MRDPRLGLVSVTDVDVARDFTVAKVFVSVIGDDSERRNRSRRFRGHLAFCAGSWDTASICGRCPN